jgi:hypothetical protein
MPGAGHLPLGQSPSRGGGSGAHEPDFSFDQLDALSRGQDSRQVEPLVLGARPPFEWN